MKLFSRRPKPAPAPAFVECRSWHGVSFHIRATSDPSGLALCGYEPLDDRSPIDRDSYWNRAPHQHEGWRYCSSCVDRFLQATAEATRG